eukprot:1726776-Pleurochrysis_carterae.AAC.1
MAAAGLRCDLVARVGACLADGMALLAAAAWTCCRSPPRPPPSPRAPRRQSPAVRARHDSAFAAGTSLFRRGSSVLAAGAAVQN